MPSIIVRALRLDRANYPRKPRGGPAELGAAFDTRWSFCCAEEGCRKRATPFSVRFLGRRVYLGVVVVLATVLAHGLTGKRLAQLRAQISDSLSAKTIKRWRLKSPLDNERLPASLLEMFCGDDLGDRVRGLLHFILPLTSSLSEQPQ